MQELSLLKIGGQVLDDPARLGAALDYFAERPGPAMLVHGGGKAAGRLSRAMGIAPRMIDGRRITDAETLEIVTMVYAGGINKQVVAGLQARGCHAIGLSGADGNLIQAHKREVKDIDYGFAGDIDAVNVDLLNGLLALGLRPVVCPITHDRAGQLLNTNADTIASRLAVALAPHYAVQLDYCFELPGVLRDFHDPTSIIPRLDAAAYSAYRDAGVISGGMLPKLDNAFAALRAGVARIRIGDLAALADGRATVITLAG
jgi:acetylglutamate kinase